MQHLFAGLTPQQAAEKLLGRALTSQTQTYQCDKCRDIGYVPVMVEGVERMQECECSVRKRTERLIARSGVSDAFNSCTFDNFIPWDKRVEMAKSKAMAYVDSFTKIENERANSLMLLGEVGSGKTMLGICVLNSLLKSGVGALYATYRDMVMELKGNVLDDEMYRHSLDKYVKPRVLFIDDLYKGATEKDPKYVYDVVNARYLAKKPLIVTSELNCDGLLDIDEAVGSRIMQMSKGFIYELRGDNLNYRLRGM